VPAPALVAARAAAPTHNFRIHIFVRIGTRHSLSIYSGALIFLTQRNNSISLHCLHIKRVTELFVFYPHMQSLLSIRQFPINKCTTG
jgi:hypothetical protein